MSYILDALRRADAERERDPARGIHAQPTAGAPASVRARVPGWAWPAGALALVAAALAIAWQRPTAVIAAAPVPMAVAHVPEAAAVPVAAVVSPPAPMPVERARPAVVATAIPHAAAPAAAAARISVTAGSAAGTGALATAKLSPAVPATAAAPAAAASSPVATPATGRIFNPAELPPDVQGALPRLAISGGVYSDNAAQRMLVVGGQVMNEGAELAPGVVLEQIRARSAVLRFRGYRYSVNY